MKPIRSKQEKALKKVLKRKASGKGELSHKMLLILMALTHVDFVPAKNAEFDAWQDTFFSETTTHLSADWGVTLPNADWTALLLDQADWVAKWAAGKPHAAGRTHEKIVDMQGSRKTLEKNCRQFIKEYIINNKKVTPGQKAAAGLTVPDDVRTFHPVPDDRGPQCSVQQVLALSHKLRHQDPSNPDTKEQPLGVVMTLVFRAILAQGAAPQPDDYREIGHTSTFEYLSTFDPADVGKRAHYYMLWEDTHQHTGIRSNLFSETII